MDYPRKRRRHFTQHQGRTRCETTNRPYGTPALCTSPLSIWSIQTVAFSGCTHQLLRQTAAAWREPPRNGSGHAASNVWQEVVVAAAGPSRPLSPGRRLSAAAPARQRRLVAARVPTPRRAGRHRRGRAGPAPVLWTPRPRRDVRPGLPAAVGAGPTAGPLRPLLGGWRAAAPRARGADPRRPVGGGPRVTAAAVSSKISTGIPYLSRLARLC